MDEQRWPGVKERRPYSTEAKVAFTLLIFIGLLGAIFGLSSFSATLSRPFQIQLASYTGEKFLTLGEQEAAEIAKQKTSDSDNDGLTDYDELNIYRTSPYLADSDSDGFDDKQEIFSNHDPNCPEGKNCSSTYTLGEAESAGSNETSDFLSSVFGIDAERLKDQSLESAEDVEAFFSQMSSEEVRDLLISQGVPKETVDALTDEQIRSLLQTSIDQAIASGQLTSEGEETEGEETGGETAAE
jgi:hypothetical protein